MQQIEDLILSDQMLKANELAQSIGPLDQWQFGQPMRKAALIMSRLGARGKSEVMDYLNYRDDRSDLERALYYQYRRLRMVPTVTVLQQISATIETSSSQMTDEVHADYLIFKAWLLSVLRDFPVAHQMLAEAKILMPNYSWLYVEEADILSKEDRYEASLESAEKAIQIRPLYHNAILQKEAQLFHLNRDEEAVELLERMHHQSEHGIYASRLQYRYSERDELDKALWALGEYQRLCPLLNKESREWCATRRADFLYLKGNIDEAKEVYASSEKEFHKSVVKNLARPKATEKSSNKLDVSFVRQHDMTCAPATLASLSAYYGEKKDHLEIAEAICYDGTPWHRERTWAEENGFLVYEFRLTEEILIELIEKELPFTLSTVAVTSAHLQACIGYDARSKIVFIRDPTERHYGEMLLDQLIEDHPVSGPRGMLFIPKSLEGKVTDTHFPDQHLYDCRHDLMMAIDAHDLLRIEQAIATMRAIDEQHPFVLQSEIRVAQYRRNLGRSHDLMQQLHEKFPEQQSFTHDYFLSSLSNCNRDEQLKIAQQALSVKSPDPVFYAEIGDLYVEDMRDLAKAEYYLKKSAVRTFSNARSLASLANCASRKKQTKLASIYRRYASCKSPSYEGYANSYFHSAVECGNEQEAITFLKQRVANYGKKESASWITLSDAYESLNRDVEAKNTILEALQQLPDDSDLLLHMVDRSYFWGEQDQAEEYLEKARAHCTNLKWQFAAGKHAEFIGNRSRALHHYQQVVEESPTFYGGLRRYASLLEDEFGKLHALDFLQKIVETHPKSNSALECYATFISRNDDQRLEPVLEQIIEIEPNDLWANRELALLKDRAGNKEEAIEIAEDILSKQPNNEESLGVLGGIYSRNGDKEKAAELFKKAILIDVNYCYAFNQWMGFLDDSEQSILALEFYRDELFRQSAGGNSINAYREQGFRYIEPSELLETLHQLRLKNPFEWQAWVEEKDHLLDMGRPEEAEKLMLEAEEMFPYIPRIQVELASVYRHTGRTDRVIERLEQALSVSPSWDWCARLLADAYELIGDYKNTERTLKQAIQWGPLIAANHGCYADFLKKLGKKDEALEALKIALTNNVSYTWGWRQIAYLAKDLKREDEVHQLISIHEPARASLVSWWDIKFDIYEHFDDQLALDHCELGIKTFPTELEPHDSKAFLLARMGKVEAAIQATHPAVFGDKIPVNLRGRRADILYDNHQQDQAFKIMEAVLIEKPDYIFAIRRLVSWYIDSENYKRAKEVATMWLRFEPRSHIARGQLGHIYEKIGKPSEAAELYQEAFQIDPEYRYAGYRGFELALESNQLDGIPQTIALTDHYGSHSEAVEMEIRYLHRQGKLDEAFQVYQNLIELTDAHLEEIGKTVDLFPKHGRQALNDLVESGKATNPSVLAAWMWGRTNYLKVADKIAQLPYDPAMKARLWTSYLEWLAESEDKGMVTKFYKKHRGIAEINTYLWGELGRQLCSDDNYVAANELLSDYQEREDVEDWMLANYATALASVKGIEAAEPVLREGMSITKPGTVFNYLSSMLVMIEAASGNDEAAQKLLDTHYGDLTNRLTAYRHLAALILIASPTADKIDLKLKWQIFKVHEPDWKNDRVVMSYINYTRQAVIAKGAKWPGGPALIWNLFKT